MVFYVEYSTSTHLGSFLGESSGRSLTDARRRTRYERNFPVQLSRHDYGDVDIQ